MKKRVLFISLIFAFSLFSFTGLVKAQSCNPNVTMINQDPYPAIPGDSVKLLFQINGVDNPDCGNVNFELVPKYPISLMPDQQASYSISAGIYQQDYKSFFLAPYNVKVSESALNGDNPIEVRYNFGNNEGYISKQFDLNVKDVRAKFEVHVKSYNPNTKTITFEILNIASSNVKAITVEVPQQKGISIEGSSDNIVGDLDSNEYTTADFNVKSMPSSGNITLNLHYSDAINDRRVVTENVSFDANNFTAQAQKKSHASTYIILILIAGAIWYYIRRRNKKKKALKEKRLRK